MRCRVTCFCRILPDARAARVHYYTCSSKVFGELEDEGHFYDPLEKEVREVFLPWVMEDVVGRVQSAVVSTAVVNGESGGDMHATLALLPSLAYGCGMDNKSRKCYQQYRQ